MSRALRGLKPHHLPGLIPVLVLTIAEGKTDRAQRVGGLTLNSVREIMKELVLSMTTTRYPIFENGARLASVTPKIALPGIHTSPARGQRAPHARTRNVPVISAVATLAVATGAKSQRFKLPRRLL